MNKEQSVKLMTDKMAKFVGHIGKKLPDDVIAKLEELAAQETAPLPKVLYETMTKNQDWQYHLIDRAVRIRVYYSSGLNVEQTSR